MDTIFMNSENSKTPKRHVLILNNKLDLRISKKVIALSNLSVYYTWKKMKSSYNNKKLKILHLKLHQHGIMNLNH